MMRSTETTDNLLKAMVEAAPEITALPKTKQAYEYYYATLDSLIDMLRKVLPKHGLWFIQSPTTIEDSIELKTRIIHVSGEWIEDSIMFEKADLRQGRPNDTQKIGAAITYFRRYALAAMFGIASDEDTDGTVTQAQPQRPKQAPKQTQPQGQMQPPKQTQAPKPSEQPQTQDGRKRDPMPYLMAICARRLSEGETKESILKHFADLLKTDAVMEISEMTDADRSYLARELYKIYGNNNMFRETPK